MSFLWVRIEKCFTFFLLLFCHIHFSWQENPNIANESAHAQAREALKKYLHYFERVRNIYGEDDLNIENMILDIRI